MTGSRQLMCLLLLSFYFEWPLVMYLIAGAGSIAFQTDTAIDIRTWLLGINTSFTNLEIPSNIQVGDYEVKLAIHDPDTEAPGVLFANTGRDSEDRYVVSNLRIE